jgi:DNA mismatch repair protein MutS2
VSLPAVGQLVRTPLGKGIVESVRNNRVVVRIHDRAVSLNASEVTAAEPSRSKASLKRDEHPAPDSGPGRIVTVDLHGLTVDAALERAAGVLNDALLADASEIHFIHGRSGGRIRAALHRWLRATSSVRATRLNPHNPGVTIVML